MNKETRNSALVTALAFHYQTLIGLEKCFDLKEGQSVFFEKDGDISFISEEKELSTQIEVKNYSDNLTDNHLNFWKTLNNWLQPEFDHTKYGSLILHTTQPFSSKSSFKDWNSSSVDERLKIIHNIYSNNSSSSSEVSKIQRNIISYNSEIVKKVIEKISLYTDAEKLKDIEVKIQSKLLGIPMNNLRNYLNELIGYVYSEAKNGCWEITFDSFKEFNIALTSIYSRKEFTLPQFTGRSATENEVENNKTKLFVSKILDIDYSEVIAEAVGNWLELINSLNTELDNSPTYINETRSYQQQLISRFNRKYSIAKRNDYNPKDLYDDIISEPPLNISNQCIPHLAYKNGLLHHAMDDYSLNLKWNCKNECY